VAWSFEGEQKSQRQDIRDMGVGAIFAMFGIFVLLAIPLRSYAQPLIVMSVIPFGLVGAVAGHLLLRMEFSIMTMCGCIALAGMVVNESLIMVDRINRERRSGQLSGEAAWRAAIHRFRPIMATSVTTFVGLIPIMSETDLQALFLVPMSVALGFGGLFSTIITLFLVPCLYLILEDVRRLLGFPSVEA
jgi:multidrug efflux pump subunit AcrB